MKSNRHIVWLTPGFASSAGDDYTTPTLQNLAKAIAEHYPSIRITIVAIHFPYAAGEYMWNNINVISIGAANSKYPKRFFSWRKVLRELAHIHKTNAIHCVHSFWYSEAALLAERFCKREGIAHVCTVMGQDAQKANRYIKLLRKKEIHTVAISERCANDFRDYTGVAVDAIIPFGLEPLEFKEQGARKIDVIGVGTLTASKRFERFITIIGLLKQRRPGIHVLLVGDGPERRKLEAAVQELDLTDTILFTGLVSRKEVLNRMAEAKVFLHTAETEGMGYVYLEAAASGCYVVSTPAGIITSDEFSFVSDNNEAMVKQILVALDSSSFRSRIPYTSKNTAAEYVDLYSNLVRK